MGVEGNFSAITRLDRPHAKVDAGACSLSIFETVNFALFSLLSAALLGLCADRGEGGSAQALPADKKLRMLLDCLYIG
jgi:hypothetical protein